MMKVVNHLKTLLEYDFEDKYESLMPKEQLTENQVFCHNNL